MVSAVDQLPPVSPGSLDFNKIRRLVGSNAPIILEIGANDGSTTQQFLQAFPRCTIFAFEPDARALSKFKSRIKDPRVRLYETAVGAHDGEAEFHVSSGVFPGMSPAAYAREYPQSWDASGSLRQPKSHLELWPWCKFETTRNVPVLRLDSWARQTGVSSSNDEWYDGQPNLGRLVEMLRSFSIVRRYKADVLFKNDSGRREQAQD